MLIVLAFFCGGMLDEVAALLVDYRPQLHLVFFT
jgi:hypothetical protein